MALDFKEGIMKVRLTAIVIFLFCLSSTSYASEHTDNRERFQLFNGNYSGLAISQEKEKGQHDVQAYEGIRLFRIDSFTGKTWILESTMINLKVIWKWVEISEPIKPDRKQ